LLIQHTLQNNHLNSHSLLSVHSPDTEHFLDLSFSSSDPDTEILILLEFQRPGELNCYK